MKIKKTRTTNTSRKTPIIISTVLVAVLLFVAGILFISKNYSQDETRKQTETSEERPVNDVDYSGPTQEDIDSSQDAKKRGDSTEQQQNASSQKQKAVVGIAYAGIEGDNFEIRAFTPTVIEGTGTCTATLVNNSETVSGESKGFIDATSSQCHPIKIPLSEIVPTGSWTINVTYSSPGYEGSSGEEVVNI